MPNFAAVVLKMWPYARKIAKNGIFGKKKLPPRKNSGGSIGKLEHRCTTTNILLCNDNVFFWKLYCFI